jgi:hypothetical protein
MARKSPTPALDGLVLRPYAGEQDIPETVRVDNAEYAADGIPERASVGDRLASYRHPSDQFDPRRDVTLAEVDGVVVGRGVR